MASRRITQYTEGAFEMVMQRVVILEARLACLEAASPLSFQHASDPADLTMTTTRYVTMDHTGDLSSTTDVADAIYFKGNAPVQTPGLGTPSVVALNGNDTSEKGRTRSYRV